MSRLATSARRLPWSCAVARPLIDAWFSTPARIVLLLLFCSLGVLAFTDHRQLFRGTRRDSASLFLFSASADGSSADADVGRGSWPWHIERQCNKYEK